MQTLKEIPPNQIHTIITRMPIIELSYETNSHKKDNFSYKIGLAIPIGKKYYAWITYDEYGEDVIYMMEINREHKIAKVYKTPRIGNGSLQFELGTIFYGTVLDGKPVFLIEDILYDCGISTKHFLFPHKMLRTADFIREHLAKTIHFALPVIWERKMVDNSHIPDNIGYPVHHIQYRCPDKIAPFINILSNKPLINIDGNLVTSSNNSTPLKKEIREPMSYKCNYRADFNRPQYRMSTIFLVKADLAADIYRLFAYGRNKTREYYGIAYIGSYETSVFMNRLFRHIK
jgi:hypothetical protein